MRKVKKGLLLLLACCMMLSCMLHQGMFIKATSERVNFALHKPVTASYHDGNMPERAVDGDFGTRWGTDPQGSNQWLRVDLEKPCDIDEFRIASENVAAQKIRKFKIEGSLDDQNYEMIYNSNDNVEGFDMDHNVTLNSAVRYQYVKITVEKLIDGAYPSISLREFQIIGNEEEHISDVKKAMAEVSIPNKVYHNFELPLQHDLLQVQFSWEALNDAIRIENGMVYVETEKNVESGLRLTASKGDYEQRQEFHFQIYKNQVGEYEIYPQVQSIAYYDQILSMEEQLQVFASEEMSSYVTAYAQQIFSEYQFDTSFKGENVSNSTNIYLGIAGSGDKADTYFSTIDYDKTLSTDIVDGYVLYVSSQDNTISILGHDASGVFNGLSTLRQMLETSRSQLKEVLVVDSPNTSFRGIVEGFYGEYSFKERMDLIQYMGPLKMNTYIYGAKSDAYHRSKWRELYPETEIDQIKQLVECGKKNNVELVWTAHVGGNINMGSQSDFDAIVHKFDQLYDVGVRQFGLFYDDASSDNTYLTQFVNRLNKEYIHQKEGVKDLIICPQHYNKNQANDAYFAKLAAFDKDVQVMWTGDGVISEISPSMMEYIEEKIQRPAYIWWNYPVNDLGMGDQLLVGETVGLSNDMGSMNGLVSNPMLQAQASKFSLFSIADYSWNIADYDKHDSWNAAVEYVIDGSDYEEAFKLFSANNNQSVAELRDAAIESAYLLDDFASLRKHFYANENYSQDALQLKEEFEKIEEACELLKSYTNKDLVNQIMPWLNQLLPIAKSGQVVMNNLINLSQQDIHDEAVFMQVLSQYQDGQATLKNISGKWSGRREIIPFLQEMQAAIHQQLLQCLGDDEAMRFITNYRAGNYVMMDLTEMIDHNNKTAKQFDEKETSGKWFGVDLGSVKDIHTLEILIGANETDPNVASIYRVQLSDDGQTWRDIETQKHQNTVTNIQEDCARFIRYYVEEGCQKSSQVREFYVNRIDRTLISNLENTADVNILETNKDIMIEATNEIVLPTQHYLGIQFENAKKIPHIEGTSDLMIEYSIDNKHWYPYENNEIIANYVRVINQTDHDLAVSDLLLTIHLSDAMIPQQMNVTNTGLVTWSGSERDLVDGNRSTYHWTRTQAIGNGYTIDMLASIPLNDITVVMGDSDFMVEGVIEISNDLNTWTPIGTIQNQKVTTVYSENALARYIRIRMTKNSDNWLKIAEIEVNKLASSTDAPVLDDELANAVLDKDLTSAYQVPEEAGSFIYHKYYQSDANTLYLLKNKEANVCVEVFDDNEWNVIDGVGDALVSYDLSTYRNLSDVRISWKEDSGLLLSELMFKKVKNQSIDSSKLEKQMERCYDLTKLDYTIDSWSELQAMLKYAETILHDVNITQIAVDEATSKLIEAQNKLLKRASTQSLQSLKALYDEMDGIRNNYTEIEFFEAAKAMELVSLLFTKDDANISIQEVQDTMMILAKAKDNLYHNVFLDALRMLCIEADRILSKDDLNDIRPGKIEALKKARQDAQVLLDENSTDIEKIANTQNNLNKAMQELYKIVDKSQLSGLLSDIASLDEMRYTENSWKLLIDASIEAQSIVENEDASEADVQEAYDTLFEALSALELRVDKTALKEQIDLANKILENSDRYVPSSIKNLQHVLQKVIIVYEAENATKQDVSDALQQLIQQIANARLKADKHLLEEILQIALTYQNRNLNDMNRNSFEKAYAEALIIMNDDNATQKEVDDAILILNEVISNLEEADKPSTKKVAQIKPATGDQTQITTMAIITSVCGVVLILLLLKKKSLKD